MLHENQFKTDALPTQVGCLFYVDGSSSQVDLQALLFTANSRL